MKETNLIGAAPLRYESLPVVNRLNDRLRFSDVRIDESLFQAWELIFADAARVVEFCDFYIRQPFEPEAKFALMGLIVASLDDLLQEKPADSGGPVQRVEQLLRQDFTLHLHTVDYWRLQEEADPTNVFAVTALMRRIWNECYQP